MVDWLLDLYRPHVHRVVLVLHPDARPLVSAHLAGRNEEVVFAEQREPTGMLDAILAPYDLVVREPPEQVWITWCDQVGVHPRTVARLARQSTTGGAAMVLPTVMRADPYVHLERGVDGRITHVRQRREGDPMPASGESEMGLFSLTGDAYRLWLPAFAEEVGRGPQTGERNFLPFIPWLAARAVVETFPAVDEMESVGINTPEDLALVERYLRGRDR
jgi:bifunctional N-acetylglucosamine-1-phosphate-uridyltransferase/glucosamine-1-phosphate-acetyltransferase GlmU-like protein